MAPKVTLAISLQMTTEEKEKEMDREKGCYRPSMVVAHFASTHFTLVELSQVATFVYQDFGECSPAERKGEGKWV